MSTTESGAKPRIPSPSPRSALPELSTYTASSEDDRIDGLKLVADSVAQQRQTAAKMLVTHPLNLALFALAAAVLAKYIVGEWDHVYLLGTTLGGLVFSCLVAVRWATARYLVHAEAINWAWLGADQMVVVKWGEEIIGALVLGWADAEGGKKKGHAKRRRGKAVVRAWTVRGKYRGKGVGEGLLEEAVRVAGERGADGIVFGGDHANSKRVLPALYNGFLDKQEVRAEKALEKVADEKGNFRQRRSSPTWGSR
ncbi:acetyltransferas-like protein [Massarina eburnea CBS 473.64]|uniref:Acetyltransferas-like protein n=1 Tax=Massarina eburnea CBS 473.64 TaxID=1395130 RepID=A0A6A6SEF5_9PLEO|nr:acetyltransferas-like protein [Massarina eburnea CBS 473.64]